MRKTQRTRNAREYSSALPSHNVSSVHFARSCLLPKLETKDLYHAAAILDSKRGWTGINNAHIFLRMHNLF